MLMVHTVKANTTWSIFSNPNSAFNQNILLPNTLDESSKIHSTHFHRETHCKNENYFSRKKINFSFCLKKIPLPASIETIAFSNLALFPFGLEFMALRLILQKRPSTVSYAFTGVLWFIRFESSFESLLNGFFPRKHLNLQNASLFGALSREFIIHRADDVTKPCHLQK